MGHETDAVRVLRTGDHQDEVEEEGCPADDEDPQEDGQRDSSLHVGCLKQNKAKGGKCECRNFDFVTWTITQDVTENVFQEISLDAFKGDSFKVHTYISPRGMYSPRELPSS